MKDPRIEAAAKALYSDVNRQHSTTKGWDEVRPRWQESYRSNARAVIAAIDNASTITTIDELEALPVGSVILDSTGLALQLRYDGCWWCTNGDTSVTAEDIVREGLPARVIHWGNNA